MARPSLEREEAIDAEGETIGEPMTKEAEPGPGDEPEIRPAAYPEVRDDPDGLPRKYYVDGGVVEIVRHLVYETDARGKKLPLRHLTDYTGDHVRTLYPNPSQLRQDWLDPERRSEIAERLEERGIDLGTLGRGCRKT